SPKEKRPVSPNRKQGHSPARPSPGARSARWGRWLFHCLADRIRKGVTSMLLNFPRFSWLRPSAAVRHLERPRRRRRPAASVRPIFELLEDRTVPSVDMSVNFNGIAFDPRVAADLPDTILAVGPNQVVEATNRDIAFFDKVGNSLSTQHLKTFWAPVLPNNLPVPGDIITDPKESFDE